MSNITGQRWPVVLQSSASLLGSGSIGGSALCAGYARIVGIAFVSASTTTGSTVRVYESPDSGSNWDYIYDFDLDEASGSVMSASLHGNAVRVEVRNGADAASQFRTLWQLRPI